MLWLGILLVIRQKKQAWFGLLSLVVPKPQMILGWLYLFPNKTYFLVKKKTKIKTTCIGIVQEWQEGEM